MGSPPPIIEPSGRAGLRDNSGQALRKISRIILLSSTIFSIVCLPDKALSHPLLAESVSTEHIDSTLFTNPDSLAIAETPPDTSQVAPDTLGRMSSPWLVGTLDRALDSAGILTKRDLNWLDYRYLGGILETVPGVYVREQFSEGQSSQLNIRGQDWRSIAITMNGRLLNDPTSGIYNIYYFTPEDADRIEIITGPRAFLYGLNSSGGVINLVTKNYNSNRPYSKINYSETAYDYQFSDGTFSQNISRKINFTFGFQHQGTIGRFPNTDHDAWNLRVKLRYNVSKRFNIILSEYLTHTQTGLNGGADSSIARFSNAFDPLLTTVRNTDSYEKVNRHDVDLSFVGTVFDDTANVSLLTFYYSSGLREYRDEENRDQTNGVFIRSDHRPSWMGALFSQNIESGFQRLTFGGNIEIRQIEGSPNLGHRRNVIGNAWGKEEFLLGDAVTVAGYARYDRYLKNNNVGVGSDATVKLTDRFSVFGGFSVSTRFPNYQELYWSNSTVSRPGSLLPEKHRQLEVGAELRLDDLSLRAAYFHRTVDDAIEVLSGGTSIFPRVQFTNVGKVATNGVEATIKARLWLLYFEGVGTFLTKKSGGISDNHFPKFSGNGGIYFWRKLLNDNLELKTGFRGRFVTTQQPTAYNPEVVAYVQEPGASFPQGSSVDFFLIAHIGNAYIHLMWENLTNARYYITPYYPVLDRVFRLGVSWEFLN